MEEIISTSTNQVERIYPLLRRGSSHPILSVEREPGLSSREGVHGPLDESRSNRDGGFLTGGLSGDGKVLEADVESSKSEWKAVQVWRVEDSRFAKRVIMTGNEGTQKVETVRVYDRVK